MIRDGAKEQNRYNVKCRQIGIGVNRNPAGPALNQLLAAFEIIDCGILSVGRD